MNKDGSYLYWYWQDNGVYNVLDENDVLAGSPLYPFDPDPELNTPKYRTGYDRLNWVDMDCSEDKQNSCPVCDISEFGKMNKITRGDQYAYGDTPYFEVIHYGVPVKVSSYHQNSGGDQGGEINIAVNPVDGTDDKLEIRVYTWNALYDYNSAMNPPPFFLWDSSMGIDYCGSIKIKVLPPDPYVNFAEYKIVDHALQNSRVNYTSGTYALSDLPTPAPQIESPYDPIIKDVGKDFRAYPGGQTHTGRVPDEQYYAGFNSYPALWPKMFNKLGTEMTPFTDYGLYFIMNNGFDDSIYWDANVENPSRNIKTDNSRRAFYAA